jgi:tetratricopeptide (TPR) repeat protein
MNNQASGFNMDAGGDIEIGGDPVGRDKITNTTFNNFYGFSTRQQRRAELPIRKPFFGREGELAKIAEALDPDSRGWGVLIDGPGGIGKTALAIEAGHLAPENHFHTKIFLSAKIRELLPQGEQKLEDFVLPNYLSLLNELARELGEEDIEKTNPNERANTVRRMLSDRHALLLIDNLETFEEPERVRVFQFLSRLPASCKAIVTSRRRSDVAAETIRLDRLSLEAAKALIAKLTERNKLLARTSEAERQQLYEVTHGNPLLIEWITRQLGRKESQCRTIADACKFIEAAPKDNDPLEYIFGDLLDTFTQSETAVLAALSHFTLPAKVTRISEIARIAESAAQTSLEDLADRALLMSDPKAEAYLLPSLAAAFLRRKHPEIITKTGKRLADRVYLLALENGYQNYHRFPALEVEWSTIAAALPLFLQGESDRLQSLCNALSTFMNFSGRWDEWLALSLQAEEKAAVSKDLNSAGRRACQAGWVCYLRGQAAEVLACARRAEAHWANTNAGAREKALVIRLYGLGHRVEKNYVAAIAAYKEALGIWRALAPESKDVASVLNDLAAVEQLSAHYISADRNYQEALRIAKKLNDSEGIAIYSGNLADLELDREDWPAAEALASEALQLSERIGKEWETAANCARMAKALVRQGRNIEGLPYAKRAVEVLTKLRSLELLEKTQEVLRECEAGIAEGTQKRGGC